MFHYKQVQFQPTPTTSPSVSRRNDSNHIPRPPNKFILYRSYKLEQMKRMGEFEVNGKRRHQNDISITVADMWKNESQETIDRFEEMAKRIAEEHKEKYPDYVYILGKSKSKKKRVGKERKDATHPYNDQSHRTDKRVKPADSDPRQEQTSVSMSCDQAQFDFDLLSVFTPQPSDAYEADPELVKYFQNELNYSDGSKLFNPYDSVTYSSGYEYGSSSESAQDFYPLDATTDPYNYPSYNHEKNLESAQNFYPLDAPTDPYNYASIASKNV